MLAAAGLATMGFNQIGIAFLPLSDLVFFVLAAVIWLLMLTSTDRSLTPRGARGASPRILIASVVMVTMAVMAGFNAIDPGISLQIVLRVAYLTLLWFWMLRCVAVDRRAVSVLMAAWRTAVIVSCAGAVAANAGLVDLGVANSENRQSAWFGHPNDLAGFLAMAVPVFLVAAPRDRTGRGRARRLRWAGLLGLVVFAIATTGSISSLLAAVTGSAAAGLGLTLTGAPVPGARRVHPITVMVGAVVALAALGLLARSDAPVFERLTRFGSGNSGVNSSVDDRTHLNEEVVASLDDVLVVGHGMDVARGDSVSTGDVHNMYLKLVFEIGVVGAAALLYLLGVTLTQAWRLMRSTRGSPLHATVVALFGSVVAALTFAFFQPINTQRYFWLPLAMVQALWTLRRRELAEAARASRPAAPDPVMGWSIERRW
ncbi:MAG TPA: O-antigen ligase family protein [Acidimicrobiales bacterium]|nr:O-antigen ligase family protein [Acidimicrobiales bacterium]